MHWKETEITRHAFTRAIERGISPDFIEGTIRSGSVRLFGKNLVKFSKKYKNFTVICIGKIEPLRIKILTIEKNEKMR